jgi:hypothetical protein
MITRHEQEQRAKIPAKRNAARDEAIRKLHAEGMTFAAIGRQVGLSAARVGQIVRGAG